MQLLTRTQVGRDINRHYYTRGEVDQAVRKPLVAISSTSFGCGIPTLRSPARSSWGLADDDMLDLHGGTARTFAHLALDLRSCDYRLEFTRNGQVEQHALPLSPMTVADGAPTDIVGTHSGSTVEGGCAKSGEARTRWPRWPNAWAFRCRPSPAHSPAARLISEETRRLVREAAECLNYRVDAAGSSLRTGLTRTVGVVIPLAHAAKQNLSDPFFLEILGAIADELSASGYSMLLQKVTDDPTDWIATLARGRRADGVIVIGQSLHHDALNEAGGQPISRWWSGATQMKDQRYITVGSDNEAGGQAATAHLIAQGCRHIAFLGDPAAPEVGCAPRGLCPGTARRRHRAQAAARSGGPLRQRYGLPRDGVTDRCRRGDRWRGRLLRRLRHERDARRCSSAAARCRPTSRSWGSTTFLSRHYTTPPLTTIRQNCHVGARLLVEKLMRAIRHERNVSAVIPTELVVRASSLREHLSRAALHSSGAKPSLPARRAAAAKPRRADPAPAERAPAPAAFRNDLMQSIAPRARVAASSNAIGGFHDAVRRAGRRVAGCSRSQPHAPVRRSAAPAQNAARASRRQDRCGRHGAGARPLRSDVGAS